VREIADIKWIKITTDMFDDEKIKLIDAMPERDTIHYVWIRLLVQAGKTNTNGYIFLSENIPFTEEMLATIFNRPLNTIRLALNTLVTFKMIEIEDDKLIRIVNWGKHQNIEGMDKIREQNGLRKQKQRELESSNLQGIEDIKAEIVDMSRDCHVTDTQQNKSKSKSKNKNKIEIEDKEDTTKVVSCNKLQPVIAAWNEIGLSKVVNIKNNRLKMLNARIKENGIDEVLRAISNINESSFLKGQNDRNWIITFDWFIKPNNFIKVLEGNYKDKEKENKVQTRTSKGNFTNYKQRDYDFEDLEKKLLGWSE